MDRPEGAILVPAASLLIPHPQRLVVKAENSAGDTRDVPGVI